MTKRITWDEIGIINAIILPAIKRNVEFNIEDIHTEALTSECKNDKGEIDYQLLLDKKRVFTEKGNYLNIVNTLVNDGFAFYSNESCKTQLTLTWKGEVLWAYGSWEKCIMAAFKETEKWEIFDRLPLIIAKAYLFGEFAFDPTMPRTTIVNINFINPNDGEEFKKIQDAIDQKDALINSYEQFLKDEAVLQFLVNEGFAINRHDIKVEG